MYDLVRAPLEAAGLATRRRRLLAEATGRVLEIGGGTGANLAHYRSVTSVTVVEPDGAMRRRLQARLADAAVPVEVHGCAIEDADLPASSFDTVVCTLVLCTVADLPSALTSAHRLLVPGGRLLYLEHVASPGVRGAAQRLVTPVWKRVVRGCHLDRDPLPAMRAAGFAVTDCERFALPLGAGLIASAVQGQARAVAGRAA